LNRGAGRRGDAGGGIAGAARRGGCGKFPITDPPPGPQPPGTGLTCDEYPFASTYEGAWFSAQAGGKPRTFDNCGFIGPRLTGPDGWSICMILGKDNLGAGGALGAFYNNNRVLDGERFGVAY